jgi:CHAT domain-containing protein/Tfp pilus assembly protein PilF
MRQTRLWVMLLCALCVMAAVSRQPVTAQADKAQVAEVNRLVEQSSRLEKEGRYDEAIPLAEKVVALVEKSLGEDNREVASALSFLGHLYRSKKDYARAEPPLRRALAIYEKVLGPEHYNVGTLLNNIAMLYTLGRDYGRAEPLLQRSLAIYEKAFGADHPNVAKPLKNLADLYKDKADYGRAEPLFQRLLVIREKESGHESLEAAKVLNDLGLLYMAKGDHARAEPYYQRALSINQKLYGAEHAEVARALNNLAGPYTARRDYEHAELLLTRALAIREKLFGAEHPTVANTLNNLGGLYDDKADFERAESHYNRALEIREKVLGANHPDVANTLDNLALLYINKGDYVRAEPLLQRSLGIRSTNSTMMHPDGATSLSNMARVYFGKGDYMRAGGILQAALQIREKTLGPEHPSVANTLHNLAAVYFEIKNYERAEPLIRRSLAINEKVYGSEHPTTASALHNLGVLYESMGDAARAKPLFGRALEIHEKVLSAEHPEVAFSLGSLASLYRNEGDYARAEPLYQRALAITEKTRGREHPYVAGILDDLSILYRKKGDYARALAAQQRTSEIEEKNIALILSTGSQQKRQLYLDQFSGHTFRAVTLHTHDMPRNADATRLALTVILQRKGRVLDSTSGQLAALRGLTKNPDDLKLLDQLAVTLSRMANLQFSNTTKLTPEARTQALSELEVVQESLEDSIGRRSTDFRAAVQPVTLDSVRQALPPGAALVELYAYRPYNPKTEKIEERYEAARYVAYVLRRDDAVPQWVDLGDLISVEALIEPLRAALRDRKREDLKSLARALDERVMRPVRKLLGETRQIFLAPDGALNLIPFAALVDEQGQYLIENYSINYLTSGRDLLRLQSDRESRDAPTVFADPMYDLAAPGQPQSVADPKADSSAASNGENQFAKNLTAQTIQPLPGTAAEADSLSRLFPDAVTLMGAKATEAALKKVSRPRLLHIATHGFFMPDRPQPSPAERQRGLGFDNARDGGPSVTENSQNPLVRSGLLFAGVKQQSSGVGEDGILTAMEVAGLDLWGTKLVVLSACETGLGDAKHGEGVYGLRRALILAGSETQVMSLWKVSDAGTRDLMVAYYTSLQRGESRTEALRQVQLQMLRGKLLPSSAPAPASQKSTRETGELRNTVPAKDYRHPYYWAPFIPSGNWRSLAGKE